jgi:hypothetical protein
LPTMIGRDFAELKDKTGKEFGRYVLANASEGEFGFTAIIYRSRAARKNFTRKIISRKLAT